MSIYWMNVYYRGRIEARRGPRRAEIFIFPSAGSSVLMDKVIWRSCVIAKRFEMSMDPRLQLCLRQGNVIYLPVVHSNDGRQRPSPIGNARESISDPAVGLRVGVAAIPRCDSMLVVGG